MALHLGRIDFTTDVYTKPEVDRLVAGAVDGRLEKQDPEGSGSVEWSGESASDRHLFVDAPLQSSGWVLVGDPDAGEHTAFYPSGVLFHRPSDGLSGAYCLPNSSARQAGALPLATEQYVDERTSSVYRFKGSVPTFDDLPRTGNETGDVWDVQDTGDNYAYVGETSNDEPIWDQLGPSMTGYQKKLTPGQGISIDADARISIPDGGVSNSMLATNAVNGAKIANLSVSTGKLTNGAVSTVKIADGAVTAEKIDPNALSGYATKDDLPTKVSDLENDAGYITDETEFKTWKTTNPVLLGNVSSGTAKPSGAVIVGNGASASSVNNDNAIAIGNAAKANNSGAIAIGPNITVSGVGSAQLGHSDTALSAEKTFRFRDTVVVNGDGKIPSANLDKAFVDKTGDTMIGGLTVPNLTVGSRADGSTVGTNSVAEGSGNTANGSCSHAEGEGTTARVYCAHAEGESTTADAECSHAEGFYTTAGGFASHAEGMGTTAQNDAEHAQGAYNASHTGSAEAEQTLYSIGAGSDETSLANAVEVMRDGKVFIRDIGGYDGTNPTGQQNPATDLATVVNGKANASDIPEVVPPSTATTAQGKAADAKATGDALALRPMMISLGDGVWQFMDGNTGFLVIGGEVTTLDANKTSFTDGEYEYNLSLSFVYAPNVATVMDSAFYGCPELTSVSLPAAEAVRDDAFSECNKLASISLPSATYIGNRAFSGCPELASISLPATETVGNSAFSECSKLASISLPSATYIGDSAFLGCEPTTIDFSSFTSAQVQSNAAGWGIFASPGNTVTVTCSDGTVTIQG